MKKAISLQLSVLSQGLEPMIEDGGLKIECKAQSVFLKTLQEFHRRDAEYAELRSFAQSGDDDWAKDLVFRRAIFLFVVVSQQTK